MTCNLRRRSHGEIRSDEQDAEGKRVLGKKLRVIWLQIQRLIFKSAQKKKRALHLHEQVKKLLSTRDRTGALSSTRKS